MKGGILRPDSILKIRFDDKASYKISIVVMEAAAEDIVHSIDGVITLPLRNGQPPTPSLRRVEAKGKSLLTLGITIAVLMMAFVGVLIVFQNNLSDMLQWFQKYVRMPLHARLSVRLHLGLGVECCARSKKNCVLSVTIDPCCIR